MQRKNRECSGLFPEDPLPRSKARLSPSRAAARISVDRLCPVLGLALACAALAGCGGYVVRGNGAVSGPNLGIGATNVSFGSVALGKSATESIVLRSNGTLPVTVHSATLSGGAAFKLPDPIFPATLSPEEETTLNIEFSPIGIGQATGKLVVTSDSVTNPSVEIGLSGAGQNQVDEQAQAYQVDLSWNAPAASSDPVKGYEIYRSSSEDVFFLLLNSSIEPTTSFTDTDVENGETFHYYVTTVDGAGNQSLPSNIANVTIP
jgi:Abnormal spindle-like microcephaly-assoc'd, ASPM-SPD-2-Hydin